MRHKLEKQKKTFYLFYNWLKVSVLPAQQLRILVSNRKKKSNFGKLNSKDETFNFDKFYWFSKICKKKFKLSNQKRKTLSTQGSSKTESLQKNRCKISTSSYATSNFSNKIQHLNKFTKTARQANFNHLNTWMKFWSDTKKKRFSIEYFRHWKLKILVGLNTWHDS